MKKAREKELTEERINEIKEELKRKDLKENGRKVMEFISIAHGNQKVRAKNSRNEEDSPKMPVETLK